MSSSEAKEFLRSLQDRHPEFKDRVIDSIIEEAAQGANFGSASNVYNLQLAQARLKDRNIRLEPYKTHMRMLVAELSKQNILLAQEKQALVEWRQLIEKQQKKGAPAATKHENERINLTETTYACTPSIAMKLRRFYKLLDRVAGKFAPLNELNELCDEIVLTSINETS